MSFWANELRAVRQAVMFFTRLPVPSEPHWNPSDLQRSAAYFPLVGWVVGGFGALAWWLGARVWGPEIASGISLATTLLVTGAFHEDGFADVCDGFGGGYTKERVLEIMRDSRVGAFGAIGVTVLLLLKWQTVAALPAGLAPGLIVAAHALSRGAAVSIQATHDYVREEMGKAKPMATQLRGGRLVAALSFAVWPLLALPLRFAWSVLAVIAARLILARWFKRRIGGYTGDCLGAAQQVTEVVFYLAVVAIGR